jgi:hypothetical protein
MQLLRNNFLTFTIDYTYCFTRGERPMALSALILIIESFPAIIVRLMYLRASSNSWLRAINDRT